MKKISINEPVFVTSMGFRKNLAAYPKRIEFRGSTYDFIDAGLRCLVKSGGRIVEVLTLSDGASQYCMKSSNCGGDWTLLSINY